MTLNELDQRSERVLRGMVSLGVSKGDRVVVISPNRIEVVELILACAKLGAVLVPVNTFLKGDLLRHQLTDADPVILVADREGLAAVESAIAASTIPHLVCLELTPELQVRGILDFYDLPVSSDPTLPTDAIEPADLISIMYTSGTTGPSKGCMMSHGYYTYMPTPWVESGWVQDGDRVFTALPLFHTGGHLALMFALMLDGGSVSFAPSFSASRFLAQAADSEASVLFGIGSMAMAILAQPPQPSEESQGFRLACFPPLDPGAQHEFETRFGTPVIAEGIGQTECTLITVDALGPGRRPGSNGRPCAFAEVLLVDEDDNPVPTDAVGELVYRPRIPFTMFSGYWRRGEATADAWRNLWHHSGDYFRKDEDGFFWFLDRKKDSIRRRGENVSSFEIESVVRQHPLISDVAVTGHPSPLGGDDIKVSIVPTQDGELDPAGLFSYFQEHLPYFCVPRYVDIRAELPKTEATNRVQKHILRAEGVSESVWDLEALGLSVSRETRRGSPVSMEPRPDATTRDGTNR